MNLITHVGRYSQLMTGVFKKPDKWNITLRQIVKEINKLGVDSLGITIIISVFIGSVITLQTVLNTANPLLPTYVTGLVTRDTLLLEFSSTILCLILAGKVGSNIASEIGTMRITEQIDALKIMGVNAPNYLIFPKIIAFCLIVPVLVIFSMFTGIVGGYIITYTGVISPNDYILGIQYAFIPYYIVYSIIKSVIFAFIITSVSAYYGYFSYGGALDVGKSSTNAVVNSSIIILLFNVLLTDLFLM
ncbi:MAG: ABC transporter permease [Paludibacteraceae bacterium]|jgi:phospholipid/cholesterol/gamma-HCH transport system permease protein|nr:ABC transporter permease [Paludibacteraceae bacterium]NLK91526.1 ABC transporter permease [Bacteroidales bacterium]MBP6436752.1 ABC transporter permease [Paludibacteraceae bacterium]MBP8627993.1 ABC transporter permease [Paludibacteraceae bacterium]MBP8781321.1 ABC transporter permease [Paludibacteraceae bacterium]